LIYTLPEGRRWSPRTPNPALNRRMKHNTKGEPFEHSVLDASIARLRPVLIKVGAAALGLFPLAASCWGLTRSPLGGAMLRADRRPLDRNVHHAATGAGLFYAICLLDFQMVKWQQAPAHSSTPTELEPAEHEDSKQAFIAWSDSCKIGDRRS